MPSFQFALCRSNAGLPTVQDVPGITFVWNHAFETKEMPAEDLGKYQNIYRQPNMCKLDRFQTYRSSRKISVHFDYL